MKLTITFIFIFTFCNSLLFGQSGALSGDANSINIRLSSAGVSTYKGIEGSPYLDENFKTAKIGTDDKSYLVRYNAYNEKIQVKVDDNKIMNLNNEDKYVVRVSEGGTYLPVKYEDGKEGFGRLLWNNSKGDQLIKRQIIELEAPTETNGYMKAQPAKFSKVRAFYYIKKQERISKIPTGNKIYKEVFDSNLKAIAKKQKLKPNNEEDLIKLCDLYFR